MDAEDHKANGMRNLQAAWLAGTQKHCKLAPARVLNCDWHIIVIDACPTQAPACCCTWLHHVGPSWQCATSATPPLALLQAQLALPELPECLS